MGSWRILFARMICSAVSRLTWVGATSGSWWTIDSIGLAISIPRSSPRRMSPSVTVPSRTPSVDTTSAICSADSSRLRIACLRLDWAGSSALRQRSMGGLWSYRGGRS
jgi:hypothetical protein